MIKYSGIATQHSSFASPISFLFIPKTFPHAAVCFPGVPWLTFPALTLLIVGSSYNHYHLLSIYLSSLDPLGWYSIQFRLHFTTEILTCLRSASFCLLLTTPAPICLWVTAASVGNLIFIHSTFASETEVPGTLQRKHASGFEKSLAWHKVWISNLYGRVA